MNAPTTREDWSGAGNLRSIACHDCDALLSVPKGVLATFSCPRCHCVVLRRVTGGLDSPLAFYLAAATFFIVGNCFPIVQIIAGGNSVQTTMIGAVRALHAEHMNLIAILVLLTTIVIPAVELFCTTAVLLLAETRHPFRTLAYFFRLRQALKPWNMVEILMLGVIVAIVKLGSLASVVLGTGLWALAAFMIAHAAATHVFDPKEFWNEIKRPA
jgi:paraquat-inducible protein A